MRRKESQEEVQLPVDAASRFAHGALALVRFVCLDMRCCVVSMTSTQLLCVCVPKQVAKSTRLDPISNACGSSSTTRH